MQQLINERTSSLLVMAIVDDIGKGKQISKDLFTQFAENIRTPQGSYTQFALNFADNASGDLIQYRCERLTDIDAVVEEEGGEHLCSMTCATTVTPNDVTFDFIDIRLTLVVCTHKRYETSGLVDLALVATDAMACRARSICVLIPSAELLSLEPVGLATAVEVLRSTCKDRVFGRDERVTSRSRLQDVRAWAQSVNSLYRLSPDVSGPYFVSLNPQLVVGEKLAHAIPEEVTYLVGEGTVASAWDFVALPATAEKNVLHPSVYSPHCRIRREGHKVWLKPECGMTYVNGNLLKEESLLDNNDRIIIGKQLAFRFVLVTSTAALSPSSRILDWELCSKEFRQQTDSKIAKGERNQMELENKSLRERVASLERQLADTHGDSWLFLTNPPSNYNGVFMWPLDLSGKKGGSDEVVIGPQGADVVLPFLTNSASLKREQDSLVFRCGSVSIPVSHGSRFTIGAHCFTVSLAPEVSPQMTNGSKVATEVANESDEVRALRLSCFDLQWAVALLFDFAFPPDMVNENGVRIEDAYRDCRKDICRDTIMASNAVFTVAQLTALNQQLTNAVRMIGAGMAKEVNATYIGFQDKDGAVKARSRNEGNVGSIAKEFFERVKGVPLLSTDLLRQYHVEAGLLLMELNASIAARSESCGGTKKASPKKGKNSDSRSPSIHGENQVPPLTNLSMLSNGSGGITEHLFEARLTKMKGFAFLASPQVIRRAGNVMDVLAVSPNPKSLWEKYIKVLAVIPVPEGSLVMRQNYFLGILDVVISTEFCVTRGLLAKRDIRQIEAKMDQWQDFLVSFASSFDEPGQQKRSAWRHEAAFQKGATPRLRPATVKAPRADLGSSVGAPVRTNSPSKDPQRNRSTTSSGKRSSSKDPALGQPKQRAASGGLPSGRTPPNLSSFGSTNKSLGGGAGGRSAKLGSSLNSTKDRHARFHTGNTTPGLSPRSPTSSVGPGMSTPSNKSPRSSLIGQRRARKENTAKPKTKSETPKRMAASTPKK